MSNINFRTLDVNGVTPTNSVAYLQRPANTTTYAAGDVISEVTTDDHFEFAGMGRGGELSGMIESATVILESNPTLLADLELWLFDTDIADVADNLAFAPTDTEILTLVGVIKFPVADMVIGLSGVGAAGNVVQTVNNINLPYRCTGATAQSLWGQLVVRNAYIPISGEQIQVRLMAQQNVG